MGCRFVSHNDEVPHPGKWIKAEIIPRGMSVTNVAKLIGVGRPALSNLLNGNAALSSDMAARIEKAFNYPQSELMEMQAKYEAALARRKGAPAETRMYVPPFLAIKANDLEKWASHNIQARSRLAVLVRTLVHSTSKTLTKVDFPGNDDAERPGWDGFVEATEGTPWVPAGRSGWEFGTNEDPKQKAEGDFNKSTRALDSKTRAEIVFVFLTPRRWATKSKWVQDKKAKGIWKDVRAYDASDIEQWLEQSLPGQAWFANETHILADGVRSLDKCWADWSSVTQPPLTGELFVSAIEASKRDMIAHLSSPPKAPMLIAADSTEEALAFLAQLFSERGCEELAQYRDRAMVFGKAGVLPRLLEGAQNIIPIVFTREVERELAPHANSTYAIVIYPRNATTAKPTIILEPASHQTFCNALDEMGKNCEETMRLANESGRSLTVLRRRLSSVPAVRTPEWAVDRQIAARLVPFMFVGAWDSDCEADRRGLSQLTNDCTYVDLERDCQRLIQLDDAPIWSLGTFRGVVSKIDLLFAIAGDVTSDDLKRYYSMARTVLGEDDPALDLDEDKRWAAPIHGKIREFSAAFRKGISDTLVLLAVHGKQLFQNRLGVDAEFEAARLVRDLLPTPLNMRILESNQRDLPTYAEAAPDVFLDVLEQDLSSSEPVILGLVRPVDSNLLFSSPSRTGLLWALEGLCWNPNTLTRAALILSQLAQVEINDKWINKPIHSLQAIFRARMPQTAASHQELVKIIKKIAAKFPDIAWKICVAQFGEKFDVANTSHKPTWRSDGYGFGESFSLVQPVNDFVRDMIDMALTWKNYSFGMLCDLVESLYGLDEEDQSRVWGFVQNWARTAASDIDKALMQQTIRRTILSDRATMLASDDRIALRLKNEGRLVYAELEPEDILNRHAWLFEDPWIAESDIDIDGTEQHDLNKHQDHIRDLRIGALLEIFERRGLSGVLEISIRGKASWTVGFLTIKYALSDSEIKKLLCLALQEIVDDAQAAHCYKNLIRGALQAFADDERAVLIAELEAKLSEVSIVQLLHLSPFGKNTWSHVNALSPWSQAKYWGEVEPDWIQKSDAEQREGVEFLLNAGRPVAAFASIKFDSTRIDARLLFDLLRAMAESGNEQLGQYMIEHYHIENAFKQLNLSNAVSVEDMARLEVVYIDILDRSRDPKATPCIPNLQRYIETHPEIFVQIITWAHKREDGGADPIELQIPPERIEVMWNRGYKLLKALRRIPGHNNRGEIEASRLANWILIVRQTCADLSRRDVADVCIGKLLSSAPQGKDGIWPCEPVREVLEDIQSEKMIEGARAGIYVSRGAHFRGEGGGEERTIADRYRKWGQELQFSHPFVSTKLLMAVTQFYDREASREDTEAMIRRRLI